MLWRNITWCQKHFWITAYLWNWESCVTMNNLPLILRRNDDVIIASCVNWAHVFVPLIPEKCRGRYFTKDWLLLWMPVFRDAISQTPFSNAFSWMKMYELWLTHWGRVTHICVGNLTIIGSDNGLSPGRRQAITWTNVGILLIGPLGTNFSEILSEIHTFSFKKMRLKVSSAKWRPCCLGLNVLKFHSASMSQHIEARTTWLPPSKTGRHFPDDFLK